MVFAVANTLAYFATLVPMVEAAHARQIRIDGTLIGVRQVLETIDEMRTIYLLTEVYRGSTPDARYPEVSDIDTLVRLVLNRGVPRESRGRDAWGNPYVVSCGGDHFEMISLGRDGIAEREPIQGWTLDFDGDIVMRDGVVVRAPFDPRDRSSHAIAEISWMPDEGR